MSKGNSAFDLKDRLIDEALITVSAMLCCGHNCRCEFIRTGVKISIVIKRSNHAWMM